MITIFYAGLLAILYVGLTLFVAEGRFKHRVGLGDGGIPALTQRIRVHANFAEYVPFALLLIYMVDNSDYSPILVHTLGILLVTGRVLHIWGILSTPNTSFGRMVGTCVTMFVFMICAVLLIWKFLILRMTGL
ncbi:MAG: glutathione metabolism protein [Micavibrio aeruginosavorus]|uniref:Glutathione metabolism protein n=1 Tax=Micavibrio aeruginosavorus TaxID=349221 RepID=A0A2W5N4C6_9BACT|nr:MAG: glutathione metabolism protein [Micavibrio aeruginosavorus]